MSDNDVVQFLVTRIKTFDDPVSSGSLREYLKRVGVSRDDWDRAVSESGVDPEKWKYEEAVLSIVLGEVQKTVPESTQERTWGGKRQGAGEHNRKKAELHLRDFKALLRRFQKQGDTLQQIARKLNDRGFKTQGGKAFDRYHIHRMLKRISSD